MTITLSWWMLVPLVLILLACWRFYKAEQEGGLSGMFDAMAGVFLLSVAAGFMLGRWLT